MATDNNIPGAEKDPQDFQRFKGLLVSEWVTYAMIVVVVAATIFGFRVGAERDAMVDRAVASLDALAESAEAAAARGEPIVCDDSLLDPEVLANDYLTLRVRPTPIDDDDPSAGFGPGLHVDVLHEKRVSGDTWSTAQRLLKRLQSEGGDDEEDADEDGDEQRRRVVAEVTDAEDDEEADDESDSRIRGLLKTSYPDTEEYLGFAMLASDQVRCAPAG